MLIFHVHLCKAIWNRLGEIPSYKLVETELSFVKQIYSNHDAISWIWSTSFSFLDIGPLSKGHALVVPKCQTPLFFKYGCSMRIRSRSCRENAWTSGRIPCGCNAGREEDCNGPGSRKLQHPPEQRKNRSPGKFDFSLLSTISTSNVQEIDHVHFHIIPKPSHQEGLVVGWPAQPMEKEELQKLSEEINSKL